MLTYVNFADAPEPFGHYSQAVVANGLVFTSMQLPIAPKGKPKAATLEQETAQVLENVERILIGAGASWKTTTHVTVYAAYIDDWEAINDVFAKRLGENRPARSIVAVAGLHKGFHIGVQAIAAIRMEK